MFPRTLFTLQERQRKAQLRQFLPRRALVKISRTTCGILSWNCSVTSRLAAYLYFSSKKPTWPKLHSLVILLLTSSATRKVHTIQLLHWAPLPKETCLLFLTWHHCHGCRFEALDFGNLEFFCSPVRPLFSWIRHHWSPIQRERICCGPQLPCLSLYVGSRLYMVLAGVTRWSVTNPLTLFGIRFS